VNIEELDDPRADELTRLAHRYATLKLAEYNSDNPHVALVLANDATDVLADYEGLLEDLQEEERNVGRGGWRNEGE
jgi:hypothetical protein